MLLNDTSYENWKIINYRRVGDLITAEFLHDLYNQAVIELNPVHFRNTVCVIENGMFKSYAPQDEWDAVAEVLGTKLIRDKELREKFSLYLERSQQDLYDFIKKVQTVYSDEDHVISPKDVFYDLSHLHFLALDRIYAINLVQFEHALGYAIDNLCDHKKDQIDSLLKSSVLTISGQEEVKALELSLKVSKGLITIEQAANEHKKEFGTVNLAYGANEEGFDNDSRIRIESLLQQSEEERNKKLDLLKSSSSTHINTTTGVIDELVALAKKLGERRDRNKALMGSVSEARNILLDKISSLSGVTREELRHYFMKDLFNLLAKGYRLPQKNKAERMGRLVLQRRENAQYGVEAIAISEQVFPNMFKEKDTSELKGIVASSGCVTGKVRKVFTIEEARKIKSDEILVAFGTDFDLMIGLQNCAGVITEEGGLLSHASVISRELKKPCLINVKNAVSLLQDGYIITLDTNNGHAKIIDKTLADLQINENVSFLSEMETTSIKGAKAQNIHKMSQAGIPVLPAVLAKIDSQDQSIETAEAVLDKFLSYGIANASFIVRSNAENEDMANCSMAGQYTSVVCQAEKGLIAKGIRDVLESYKKPKTNGIAKDGDPGNCVLIQPYYPQEYGGVAFSHHPITGEKGIIIEGSRNGAAAVVEGSNISSVPHYIQESVKNVMKQIEGLLNCPADIEWGYGADGLKVFQARPIVFNSNDKTKVDKQDKKLIIIAGGKGSRIKEMFKDEIAPFTKHFLPIPENGGTILGSIVEKSKSYFDSIEISGSANTLEFIEPIFASVEKITISKDESMIGPLYPPFQALLATKKRVYACCGDIYSNFNWDEMEQYHNSHGGPVTILVSESFPAEKAACFMLDKKGKIYDWERKIKSSDVDLINIGAYIFDPKENVIDIATNLIQTGRCKEDVFFEKCIERNILQGYKTPEFSCNINVPEVYQSLVRKLITRNVLDPKHVAERVLPRFHGNE